MSKWIRWTAISVAALLAIATILFALHSQILGDHAKTAIDDQVKSGHREA